MVNSPLFLLGGEELKVVIIVLCHLHITIQDCVATSPGAENTGGALEVRQHSPLSLQQAPLQLGGVKDR